MMNFKVFARFLRDRVLDVLDYTRRSASSTEAVFTNIYKQQQWGGPSSQSDYDSGLGSAQSDSLEKYIRTISELVHQQDLYQSVFVDLGCGDFRVGEQLAGLAGKYIGIDIVPSLVARNNRLYGSARVSFVHLDAVTADLPEGDVCFVRQVFQHLSNSQIMRILPKLRRYRIVFITEHVSADAKLVKPNVDKIHGADIRVHRHSGIYLDRAPFNLPLETLSCVLEAPGTDLGPNVDPGVIRTYLYRPSKHLR